MKVVNILKSADLLPETWDHLTQNYFQRRKFLIHTEKYNPCRQRYYLFYEDDIHLASAIMYTLQLDLLTFLHLKSPLKMHIVGIPCSVSSSGIFGDPQAIKTLRDHIFRVEKGFVLFLNLEETPEKGNYAFGKTLPTIQLINNFGSWDTYTASLRSPYRRRLKLLLKPQQDIQVRSASLLEFNNVLYEMYLEVWKRSNGKLEKLSIDFFRNLPTDFVLMVCSLQDKPIGWNLALQDDNTYYFFLGGIDYRYNTTVNTYFKLLALLVKNGMESNSKLIDLGQTAETPKMRMGGQPVSLYMQARHSHPFFNYVLKKLGFLLAYKMKATLANPLKITDHEDNDG